MSICRAQLCNTSNALTSRMSGEHIRLQTLPKLFELLTSKILSTQLSTVSSRDAVLEDCLHPQ